MLSAGPEMCQSLSSSARSIPRVTGNANMKVDLTAAEWETIIDALIFVDVAVSVDPATIINKIRAVIEPKAKPPPREKDLRKAPGGYARAASLTPERRSEIASIAATERWKR